MYEVIVRGPTAEAVVTAIALLAGKKPCGGKGKKTEALEEQVTVSGGEYVRIDHNPHGFSGDSQPFREPLADIKESIVPPAASDISEAVSLMQQYVQQGGEQGVANALKLLGEFGAVRVSGVKAENMPRLVAELRKVVA